VTCEEARRLLPNLICVRVSRRRQGSMSVGESLGTAIVRKSVSSSMIIGESKTDEQQPWWCTSVLEVVSRCVKNRGLLEVATSLLRKWALDLARAYVVSGPCQ
jgi:hypothetical protein